MTEPARMRALWVVWCSVLVGSLVMMVRLNKAASGNTATNNRYGFTLVESAKESLSDNLEQTSNVNTGGQFSFTTNFSKNPIANLLLGLPTKTYVAQSGPDVHAHTIQTGIYGQDEFRLNDRLTLTYCLRWQALPAFVSDYQPN